MSWSPELYIGEMRPWPNSVRVRRGRNGESRDYVTKTVCLCRDCKHGTLVHGGTSVECHRRFTVDCYDCVLPDLVNPDGFCSEGELRDEGTLRLEVDE